MKTRSAPSDLHPWLSPDSGWMSRLARFLAVAGAGDDDTGDDATGDDDGTGDEAGGGDAAGDEEEDYDSTLFGEAGDDPAAPDGDDENENEDKDENDEGGDDDSGSDDDDDDDEDEESEFEPGEAATLLAESWNSKLERAKSKGEGQGAGALNLQLGSVQLSDAAFGRYEKALENADDGDAKATAKAMFELAVDAVIQTLPEYHHDAVQAPLEKTELAAGRTTLENRMKSFVKTPEGKTMDADTKLKARMSAEFDAKVKDFGWRLAMQVPYKDYYRMAGGKLSKKAGKSGKAAASKADAKKEAALAAARAPQGRRSTASSRKRSSEKTTAQRSAEYLRDTGKPFFSVS